MPPEERRRAILDAAVRVFARKGAHATRVGDIAVEAGVSHGLLYHYFSSKDEVLETVIADAWGRLVDALRMVVDGDAEPDEKLRHVVVILLRSWRFEPDAVRVLVREVGRGPKLEAHLDEVRDAFHSIRAVVEEGQTRGVFRKDVDARQASWVVYGAVEELLTGWALGTLPGGEEDVARAEQTVVAVVCGGLAVRAVSTA